MPIPRLAFVSLILVAARRADAERARRSPELDNFLAGYTKKATLPEL